MRNRSDSRNVPQTEEQRLTQLKRRIWGAVAKNLLNGKKNPYVIAADKIEPHGNRIGKAVKDLDGLVSSAGSIKDTNKYSSTYTAKGYRVFDFETQSADLAVAPTFITTWQEFHQDIFIGYGINSQQDFDKVGYLQIEELRNGVSIYAYWHRDEYEIITDENKDIYIYPRALLETRTKAILRAIVEQHYQDDYNTKLERYLDIPEGSLKRDAEYQITVRNFSAYAADFTAERFYGPDGFRAEYSHHREYLDALLHNLNKMDAFIQSKGGYAEIAREMRRASIVELLVDAPLRVNYDDDEVNKTSIASKEYIVYKKKYPSTFLLRHSEYFDYETLFSSDESVTYLKDDLNETRPAFHPNEDERHIVEAYKKEMTCSQENNSAVSLPT